MGIGFLGSVSAERQNSRTCLILDNFDDGLHEDELLSYSHIQVSKV